MQNYVIKNNVEIQIKKLINQIQQLNCFNGSDVKELISDLYSELEGHEYRISVVGEFSSGKSTFLNALIGKNLLPHAKSETTATITYIHNVPKGSDRENTAEVVYNNNQVKTLGLQNHDVLAEYLTAFSKQDVAKNIQCVNVYVNFAQTNDRIVLVDTPGLNGVADGHRDLTMREIQRSNASICLFHLKGIGETDLNFITELMKYQDKFYFVINGIDDLKASEGESYETRLESFRKDIADNIPNGKGINADVYGISALNALASRDLSIKRLYEQDIHDLSPEDRIACFERSKIDILEKDLYAYLSSDEKTIDLYLSILGKLQGILESQLEAANTDLTLSQAKLEDCPQKQSVLKAKAELGPKIERMKRDLTNQLGAKVGELGRDLRQLLTQAMEQKRQSLTQEVQSIDNLDTARAYMEHRNIVKSIESFVGLTTSMIQQKGSDESSIIYKELLLTMQRVFPKFAINDTKITVNGGESFQDVVGTIHSSDRIDQLKERIQTLQRDITSKDQEHEKAKTLQQELEAAKKKLHNAESELQRDIAKLGTRPRAYCRTETRYRERTGILGAIRSFFGSKYEEYEVEVWDDSDGEDWDDRMDSVKRSGRKKIDALQHAYDKLQESSSNVDPVFLSQQKDRLMEKLRQTEKDIIEEQERIKEEERLAKSSALKRRKEIMLKDVNRYLMPSTGELFLSFVEGINKLCNNLQQQMQTEIINIWEQKKRDFLSKLDQMIAKIDGNTPEDKQNVDYLKDEITQLQSFTLEAEQIRTQLVEQTNELH